jgi:uncharacterized protein (TIGR00255 family)
MKIRSMTGFARARRTSAAGEATVTIKSVNHRALDTHLHMGQELEMLEPEVRRMVRESVSRGHVNVRISFTAAHAASGAGLNRPLFEAYLAAVKTAAEEYGAAAEPDFHSALQIPGMMAPPRDTDTAEETAQLVRETLAEALLRFNEFREREGAALGVLMRECGERVERRAVEIEQHRGDVMPWLRQRLEERLGELLANTNLEPQRLAQEAALLADRSDIAEETGRLRVHARELLEMLNGGGEVGKKLDFLLQEMNRETNTILSKTSGAGELGLRISSLGLENKTDIERIREQALNIE